MDSKPLVSVIINNYNYGVYLGEAIRSVLDQSYERTEIIVVDDGSTDHSREVVERYIYEYPGRIQAVFKENGGQASAMNAGFARSAGEIICFLDSDDYWFGKKIERVVEAHKQYGVVQHNLLQNGQRFRLLLNTGDLQYFLKEFGLTRSCVPTSGLSFRRDVLNLFFPLPEEELKLCADVYLRCAGIYFSKATSLNECLGVYRLHGDNLWNDHLRFTHPDVPENIVDLLNKELEHRALPEIPRHVNSRELAFLNSVDIVNGWRYILYGAGDLGRKMARRVEEDGGIVVAFCDDVAENMITRQNDSLVYLPEHLKQIRSEYDRIIVSSIFVERMYEKLLKLGFDYDNDILLPIDIEGHVKSTKQMAK